MELPEFEREREDDRERGREPEPLGPDSLAWRLVGDWRFVTVAVRALLLQVGHPVVAAGVGQYSSYLRDPYGRLDRTLRMALSVVYGGPRAAATGRALRQRHAGIEGVDAEGRRWRALDAEPFLWVHATLFESIHAMCTHFARPLTDAESAQLYDEFRRVGRLYGIGDEQMPPDVRAFWAYYERMLRERVGDNAVVRQLLDQLAHPPRPDALPVPAPLWAALTWPLARVHRLVVVGVLPPALRERWGLRWTAAHEAAFRGFRRAVRAAADATPFALRYHPQARAAWRRAGIAR